jgi:hypothetical protein
MIIKGRLTGLSVLLGIVCQVVKPLVPRYTAILDALSGMAAGGAAWGIRRRMPTTDKPTQEPGS